MYFMNYHLRIFLHCKDFFYLTGILISDMCFHGKTHRGFNKIGTTNSLFARIETKVPEYLYPSTFC